MKKILIIILLPGYLTSAILLIIPIANDIKRFLDADDLYNEVREFLKPMWNFIDFINYFVSIVFWLAIIYRYFY